MPVTLSTPQSITVNQAKITHFEVNVEENTITIYYDKGFDNNGVWTTVEKCSHTLKDQSFPTDLYSSVKNYLYGVLTPIL